MRSRRRGGREGKREREGEAKREGEGEEGKKGKQGRRILKRKRKGVIMKEKEEERN